ncbi:outer membrane beta-barrel protein [Ancylobacter sp. MQZ15Z-1]|uniref:Outer membrane beta-barrel protein n=1 Tax=Ancylobacter mangrovi TaxID=2972472 RepID=A0A9X2T3U8_9HYPH|nr:outer membrane beta-barrel protein [Ancylobacter mangrovi]MCS0493839.1 outer membrane beta-barrel protein [Ancylobacter mangrovi]
MGTFRNACTALVAGLTVTAGTAAQAGGVAGGVAGGLAASARPAPDWSGFYAGAQAGQAFSIIEKNAFVDAFEAPLDSYGCTGSLCDGKRDAAIGGLTVGYNWHYADGSLIGVEADVAYSGLDGAFDFDGTTALSPVQRLISSGHVRLHTPFIGTARLRLGYAVGPLLPFVTAGLAVTYSTAEVSGDATLEAQLASGAWVPVGGQPASHRESAFTAGWTAGGGVEYALSDEWSAKVDYLYVDLITSDLGEEPPQLHLWRAGLNYRF